MFKCHNKKQKCEITQNFGWNIQSGRVIYSLFMFPCADSIHLKACGRCQGLIIDFIRPGRAQTTFTDSKINI